MQDKYDMINFFAFREATTFSERLAEAHWIGQT
jgi:hypothetical protein